MSPARPLRVAMAGAGMVSGHHLLAWSRVCNTHVVAICDTHIGKARSRAEQFNIPRVYASVGEMLDVEQVDAIDIAVAPAAHGAVIKMAVAAGVAVFCQKPLAPAFDDASELVDIAEGRIRLMVHENWRYRPWYRQTAAWLADGRLGEVTSFRLAMHSSGLVPGAGGTAPALSRQPFLAKLPRLLVGELLVHHIDLIRFLLGEVEIVGAIRRRHSALVRGEDVAELLLVGSRGLSGSLSGHWSAPGFPVLPTDRLEIIGSAASLLLDGTHLSLVGDDTREARSFDFKAGYQASYDGAIAHFAYALRNDLPFESDARQNLENLRLVEAFYRRAAGN